MVAAAQWLRQGRYALVWVRPRDKTPQVEGWSAGSQEPGDYRPDGHAGDAPGEPATAPMTLLWDAVCDLSEAGGGRSKRRQPVAVQPPRRRLPRGGQGTSGRTTSPPAWDRVPVEDRVARCRRYL